MWQTGNGSREWGSLRRRVAARRAGPDPLEQTVVEVISVKYRYVSRSFKHCGVNIIETSNVCFAEFGEEIGATDPPRLQYIVKNLAIPYQQNRRVRESLAERFRFEAEARKQVLQRKQREYHKQRLSE